MLGCEVEGYAIVGLAQERLAGGLGREHARLAFDAELAFETAGARNQANDGLGEVDVEIVADDVHEHLLRRRGCGPGIEREFTAGSIVPRSRRRRWACFWVDGYRQRE